MTNDYILTDAVMSSTCALPPPPLPTIVSPPIPPASRHPSHCVPHHFPPHFFPILISPFYAVNENQNISFFFFLTGEREEVHAPPGQPEGPRCGEELHVQQAYILHFQHGVQVSRKAATLVHLHTVYPCSRKQQRTKKKNLVIKLH